MYFSKVLINYGIKSMTVVKHIKTRLLEQMLLFSFQAIFPNT